MYVILIKEQEQWKRMKSSNGKVYRWDTVEEAIENAMRWYPMGWNNEDVIRVRDEEDCHEI